MSNGKKNGKAGRPYVTYVSDAIDMILSSKEPLSTKILIKKLGLNEHEGITLRRGLRSALDKGEIKQIIGHPDGSFSWVRNDVSAETCAAHAANFHLQREKAKIQVDPESFESFLKHEGSAQR